MKNAAKLRDEWRALNVKINNQWNTHHNNTKAGRPSSDEWTKWITELMEYRDSIGAQLTALGQ